MKELKMKQCSKISDVKLAKVFQNCQNLETIDISFCNFTGQCFCQTNGNLKSIILNDCNNVIVYFFLIYYKLIILCS